MVTFLASRRIAARHCSAPFPRVAAYCENQSVIPARFRKPDTVFGNPATPLIAMALGNLPVIGWPVNKSRDAALLSRLQEEIATGPIRHDDLASGSARELAARSPHRRAIQLRLAVLIVNALVH